MFEDPITWCKKHRCIKFVFLSSYLNRTLCIHLQIIVMSLIIFTLNDTYNYDKRVSDEYI